MLADLQQRGSTLLKAGIRTGKSLMYQIIAESQDYDLVCVFNGAVEWARDSHWEGVKPALIQMLPTEDCAIAPKRVLVIIDNAMWWAESWARYEAAVARSFHVIVCSSNGPEFNAPGTGWRTMQGQSYHTWELNPRVSRESLEDEFVKDRERAVRDFCAF